MPGTDYDVPGVACPGCGALPDQQHLEECRERIDGPEWPGDGQADDE
jgi:hypothetical protein